MVVVHQMGIGCRRRVMHNVKGIVDIEIRIVIERCRSRIRQAVTGTEVTIGTEQDVRQRVWLPFETYVAVPGIATRELFGIAVAKGAVGLGIEVLGRCLVEVVAITMVPAHRGINLQFLAIIVIEVRTQHLTGIQSATVPPTGILLLIIKVTHQHKAHLVGKTRTHATRSIAVLRTARNVEIGHVATVHTLLDGEVDDGLLVAVFNTRNTCLIGLLVVELHVLDDIHRDIFQGSLNVTQHELLTIKQDFLDHLAIDGDVAILVNLSTRDALNQFLNGRAFGCTVGIWIIHQRILLDDNLGSTPRDHHLFQHGRLRRH